MSVLTAIEEIAEQMEEESETFDCDHNYSGDGVMAMLIRFAKQLRTILKTVDGLVTCPVDERKCDGSQ